MQLRFWQVFFGKCGVNRNVNQNLVIRLQKQLFACHYDPISRLRETALDPLKALQYQSLGLDRHTRICRSKTGSLSQH